MTNLQPAGLIVAENTTTVEFIVAFVAIESVEIK